MATPILETVRLLKTTPVGTPEETGRWLPVPGYEGFYEVSDRGQVRSLDRYVRHPGGGTVPRQGKVLTASPGPAGYPMVWLHREGREQHVPVHRLVLEAFAGPCPPGQECLHGPGGPADNRWPEAIRWGTRSENAIERHRDGTMYQAKLTPERVVICRERHARGETYKAIAADYGVHATAIHKAVTRATWGHVA